MKLKKCANVWRDGALLEETAAIILYAL